MATLLQHDDEPLPPGLTGLRRPFYLHRTPAWKPRLLLGLALAVVTAGLASTAWRISDQRGGFVEWTFFAFLLLFFVVLVRPASWQPSISMAADDRGLYFLGSDARQPAVFVPWSDVGAMTIERRSAGGEGVARTVVLAIADASPFWDGARNSSFLRLVLDAPDAAGRRTVPIGNVGLDPDATREALEALRRRAA